MAPRVLLGSGTAKVGVPDIQRRVAAVRDHVLATEPLSAEQMARIGWSQRQGIYDTRTQLNYFRLTRDNRIIFGGLVSYHFDGHAKPPQDEQIATYHRLAQAFYRTFPQLADVRFSHAWGGPIDYCSRGSVFAKPYLGGKAVFVAGYTGFGIGASRFGARMGLNMLLDSAGPERQLDIARLSPPLDPARAAALAGCAHHLSCLRWRRCRGRLETRLDPRHQGPRLSHVTPTMTVSSLPPAQATQSTEPSNADWLARRQAATPRGVAVLEPFFAARALNAELWDVEGRRFIDFASGIAVLNTGHRHPRVQAALQAQLEQFHHTAYQVVPYAGYVSLAERINALTPGNGAEEDRLLHHRRRGGGERREDRPRRHRSQRRHRLRRRLSRPAR